MSNTSINTKRADVIRYISGLPTVLPTVTSGIVSPVGSLSNLSRTDQLDLNLSGTCVVGASPAQFTAHLLAYHWVPIVANGKAALHCGGHANTFDDDKSAPGSVTSGFGDWRMISSLLTAGFDVIGYYMPTYGPVYIGLKESSWPNGPDGAGQSGHNWLIQFAACPLRYFLGLPIACVNYLVSLGFTDITSIGLSGGGWSSTWLTALDTRISRGYSVAGTQPLYMRSDGSIGDVEQFSSDIYRIVNYLDLYCLAAQGRRHIQIYNRGNGSTHLGDDICFGPRQYSTVGCGARIQGLSYDQAIADMKAEIVAAMSGVGTFDILLDQTADAHQITWWAAGQIVTDIG